MIDELFVAVSNHLRLHDQWVEINEVHDKMVTQQNELSTGEKRERQKDFY